MRKITEITLIALSILISLTIKAQSTGTVIEEYIPSESIKNNIWGDTLNPKAIVYLPPSYYNSTKEYPVIYFLTGSFAEVDAMINGAFQGLLINESLDSLILSNVIKEMIVVVATAKVNLFDTGIRMPTLYVNSLINGNWEDFIVNDLITYIDNKYKTKKDRLYRGLAGHSMGGFGTIRLALLYPEKFSYAYSVSFGMEKNSGENYNRIKKNEIYRNKREYELKVKSQNLSVEDGISEFLKMTEDRMMVWRLALGTSFRPFDTIKPPFYHIPLKVINDSIVVDIEYTKSIDKGFTNINAYIEKYNKKEVKLNGIVMEVGLKDGKDFVNGSHYTSGQFIENNIPHQLIYSKYGHSDGLKYQLINSMLPYFSKHLGNNK
ncbi:alpha/beta hydrolase [Bacteroidota bacterium]